MIKQKKILLFILIFIAIVLLGNSKVFAVFTFTYSNVTYNVTDLPSDNKSYQVIMLQYNSSTKKYYIHLYTADVPMALYKYSSTCYGLVVTGNSNNCNNYEANASSKSALSSISWGNPSQIGTVIWSGTSGSYGAYYFYSNHELRLYNNAQNASSYSNSGYSVLIEEPIPPENYENLPYFLNSDEDIALGEQDLIIMPADFPNDKNITFAIQEKTEYDDGQGGTVESWHNIFSPITLNKNSEYYCGIDETGVGFYYKIPWEFLRNYLKVGNQYDYILSYTINKENITEDLYVTYGGLTEADALKNSLANQSRLIQEQTVVQTEILQTQQETNNKLNDLNNTQQETNNKLNHLNDDITDSNIESSASDLPSTDVNDITANGIDNIFQSIYNAFCVGQAQDIVFPIPFTNKNITLSPYYIRDMLQNNGAGWIYTFIQAFWAYLIGRFIVKDISKKISKIKSGNIESIQDSNIKEDML